MRFVRMALALTIIIQAVASAEILFTVLGGFLLFQAAFNYGCCGAGGCDINHNTSNVKSLVTKEEVITFKEVK